MKFYLGSPPEDASFPCFVLRRSSWDDFGFQTSFTLVYFSLKSESAVIGTVKIAEIGQASGRTKLPHQFEQLEPKFFSLGQSDLYYRRILALGREAARSTMQGLQDVRHLKDHRFAVEKEKAFNQSLVRSLGSMTMAGARPLAKSFHIEFQSSLHGSKNPTVCKLDFELDGILPGNLNALIGKNGAGKTQLLANFVAGILGIDKSASNIEGREIVRKVIVVSYSIFDRFFLPGQIKIPGTRIREEYLSKDLKYVYIGFRERAASEGATVKIAGSPAFSRRFGNAIRALRDAGKFDHWQNAVSPILREADFNAVDLSSETATYRKFRQLGAGHKATLSMLATLYSELVTGTMVVIDEPENHLHPALLSATVQILRTMLNETRSFGVISTHSPNVIREIPSKYVQVIHKTDGQARVHPIRVESFGTSVDSLTSSVFGVPVDMPSYVDIFKNLADRGLSVNDLEDALGMGLSAEAKSFYLSISAS